MNPNGNCESQDQNFKGLDQSGPTVESSGSNLPPFEAMQAQLLEGRSWIVEYHLGQMHLVWSGVLNIYLYTVYKMSWFLRIRLALMIVKSMGIQRSRGLLEQPRLTDQVVTISEVGVEGEHGGQPFWDACRQCGPKMCVGGYWEEYTDLFKLSLIGWNFRINITLKDLDSNFNVVLLG